MRLRSLLLISSFTLGACSTAATQNESAGNTNPSGSASGTETGTTDTAGMGTTTSGPGGSTDSPTTGLSESTGTTGEASTMPVTSTTEATTGIDTGPATTSGTTTLDTTTTGGTTTGQPDTGTSSDTDTGGMGGGPCEVDADCKLHDDCCDCYGIPVDQEVGSCKALCDETMCKQIGIDQAVCRFGQCTTEKVDCSSPVACDSLPPDCPPGTLPGVEGACWSGACVPVESCDKVPDCKLCPDTLMCVVNQAFTTDRTCLPLPEECGGKATCACAEAACVDPFTACNEAQGDDDLICGCPQC